MKDSVFGLKGHDREGKMGECAERDGVEGWGSEMENKYKRR